MEGRTTLKENPCVLAATEDITFPRIARRECVRNARNHTPPYYTWMTFHL